MYALAFTALASVGVVTSSMDGSHANTTHTASRASLHTGVWSAPPEYCGEGPKLQGGMTDAALLGNGDLGVSLCGSLRDGVMWFIGKNDFGLPTTKT